MINEEETLHNNIENLITLLEKLEDTKKRIDENLKKKGKSFKDFIEGRVSQEDLDLSLKLQLLNYRNLATTITFLWSRVSSVFEQLSEEKKQKYLEIVRKFDRVVNSNLIRGFLQTYSPQRMEGQTMKKGIDEIASNFDVVIRRIEDSIVAVKLKEMEIDEKVRYFKEEGKFPIETIKQLEVLIKELEESLENLKRSYHEGVKYYEKHKKFLTDTQRKDLQNLLFSSKEWLNRVPNKLKDIERVFKEIKARKKKLEKFQELLKAYEARIENIAFLEFEMEHLGSRKLKKKGEWYKKELERERREAEFYLGKLIQLRKEIGDTSLPIPDIESDVARIKSKFSSLKEKNKQSFISKIFGKIRK